MRWLIHSFLLASAAWGLGPMVGAKGAPVAAPAAEHVSIYQARGTLQSYDARVRQVVIAHEEIPGYMPAMTMSFEVRGDAAIPDMQPGDALGFQLCVSAQNAWIEQVRKMAAALPGTPSPFAPAPPPASPARELSVGDLLPDGEFTDEHGGKISLRDFRGQPVAITFIYTRCPLPTYCPLMNRNFQTAQSLLERLGAGDHWHFLSVSLDPEHDTPVVLAAFAEGNDADARHWNFVTLPTDSLHRLGAAVGLDFSISKTGVTHNLRTVVVDASGHLRKIFRGNDWTPQELAAEMSAALRLAR